MSEMNAGRGDWLTGHCIPPQKQLRQLLLPLDLSMLWGLLVQIQLGLRAMTSVSIAVDDAVDNCFGAEACWELELVVWSIG